MSPSNETTRILTVSAKGDDSESGARPGRSGSNEPEDPLAKPEASDSIIGSQIGAYLITKRLGAGGVGEVFKGVDVMLQREVAIKVLRDELTSDLVFLKRFSNEAQFLAKLNHPNVAHVHAFLSEGGKQFMVMEYVPGISLDEFIRSGGPLPVERALSIFRKALDGIGHAHAHGIVHRDIKPANIMLSDSGQVKVMDFGIARALDSQEQLTRHGQVAGTAKAMAPEQIRGAQADVRSDIYSLGIVLYTLLAGRPPFQGQGDHALMLAQLEQAPPPLGSWVDKVPPKLEGVVMRSLEKDPAARFQSVADFARAIDACQADVSTVAPPVVDRLDAQTSSRTVINPILQGVQRLPSAGAGGPLEKDTSVPRRKWPRLAAGAAALAVAAIGAGVFLWSSPTQKPIVSSSGKRTLSIVRMPTDAPTASSGLAAAVGAAGSADLNRFKPGELINLRITPNQDAHVYCYLQDETRRILRFYPNRFSPSALVRANAPLEVPGAMRFELVANSLGVPETIACFASESDVAGDLPASVSGTDLTALPVASLDEVREAFTGVATNPVVEARFEIAFK